MESQAKQDDSSKSMMTKEIEKFKADFIHILNDKNMIIDSQAKQIAGLSIEIQHLNIEKLNMKPSESVDSMYLFLTPGESN